MQATLNFLRDLSANNNREWFNSNKDRYIACHEHFLAFSEKYIDMLSSVDPSIQGLMPKDCIWRIYREKFDWLTMTASSQEVRLYACRIGQSAVATGSGSLYTQTLLDSAISMCSSRDVEAITAHKSCCDLVSRAAIARGYEQNPVSDCVFKSELHKPLPFAISAPESLYG